MSVDLNKLDSMLDKALNKETDESLNEWIDKDNPLFTLTAEEVMELQSLFYALKIAEKNGVIHIGVVYNTFMDCLLGRINNYLKDDGNEV